MNEESQTKLNENQNPEKQNKKIYETRKIKIDYTRIGEKLSLTRNYCHYCRSITTVQDSDSCKNSEKINTRKRNCNKTFCKNCITNNFPSFLTTLYSSNWICPCCKGVCNCSSCKKNKNKKISEILIQNSNLSISPNNSLSNGQNNFKDNNNNINLIDNLSSSKYDPNVFDWAGVLTKLLGKFNKEKYSAMPRPKIDTNIKNYFLKLKRLRDDFIVVKEKFFKEKEDKKCNNDDNIVKKEKN